MSKAELQAEQRAYDRAIRSARDAASRGSYSQAVGLAREAWPHAAGMMRYERRWEEREFESIECVDLVLRYAPLVLDEGSLTALSRFLKECKYVDRYSSDDLALRVAAAVKRLGDVYRILDLLERMWEVRQADLSDRLGGDQDDWRSLAEALDEVGLIRRSPAGGTYRLRLTTDFALLCACKCAGCGRVGRRAYRDILAATTGAACECRSGYLVPVEG